MAQVPSKRRKLLHGNEHVASAGSDVTMSRVQHVPSVDSSKPTGSNVTGARNIVGADIISVQINDLLRGISRARRKRLAAAEVHLKRLKRAIEALPDRQAITPHEGRRLLWNEAKVAVPYPFQKPDKDVKYTVAYSKPSQVNVVGDFALNTAFVDRRRLPCVDMAVTMPSILFQDKDYLDYRYFVKRAFYIANVVAALSKSEDLGLSFEYEYMHGNQLLPVIIAKPDEPSSDPQYRIRIITSCNTSFPPNKTLPFRSCLRNKNDQGAAATQATTPIYNATLRAEENLNNHFKVLHRTCSGNESFADACTLMNVWLSQRGRDSSIHLGGFGAMEASLLLALLLQGGGSNNRPFLSSGYNSFQLFKACLQVLASRDLIQEPLMFGDVSALMQGSLGKEPLIWDGARAMNIVYRMSVQSYLSLRYWARWSLACFATHASDMLETLFVRRSDLSEQRFDDLFEIELKSSRQINPRIKDGVDENFRRYHSIFKILERGLGERAMLIDRLGNEERSWSIRDPCLAGSTETIRIGLLLDPAHADRTLDRGPSAEDRTAAASFRKFWGDRAELRRFQDSSILESLVWEEGDDAAAVHRQVVGYLCDHHLKIQPHFLVSDYLARDIAPQFAFNALTGMNSIWRSYEDLQSKIRALENLPLQVRNFVPTSFKITNLPSCMNEALHMDISLQFEGSARWPEDLIAIQRTKIAFLAKLQSLLQTSKDPSTCCLYNENTMEPLRNSTVLQVQPAAHPHFFHIRIHHEREQNLLSDILHSQPSARHRQACSEALSAYHRVFLKRPNHLQALRRLSLQMPLLLPTIMLFRKWCSMHLLDSQFSHEFQDLVVINIFTSPAPFHAPANVSVGFVRVLYFLSKWDWWNEPLIVNFGEMTPVLLQEVMTRFEAWRKIDPGLHRTVVFAASDLDVDGTTWTQHAPSKAVATRLSTLAKKAIDNITIEDFKGSLNESFRTGFGDYDFVVHLKPRVVGTSPTQVEQFKNLQYSSTGLAGEGSSERVPSLFIQEIMEMFRETALLFHDDGSRPLIAGVWLPIASKQWKATMNYSTIPERHEMPRSDADKPGDIVVVNRTAVLSELAALGANLIKKIEIRSGAT